MAKTIDFATRSHKRRFSPGNYFAQHQHNGDSLGARIGRAQTNALAKRVTLPKVKFLERPDDDDGGRS